MNPVSDQSIDHTIQNIVAIGAEDVSTIARIEEAVLEQNMGLDIVRFTTRKPVLEALQVKQTQLQKKKGWVPLVFVCTDSPSGRKPAADSHSAPSLLRVAKNLAKVQTLVVVAIGSNPCEQVDLLEGGCAAAATLDEIIEAIPTKLSAWLIHRR